jgi:hypothetical protein
MAPVAARLALACALAATLGCRGVLTGALQAVPGAHVLQITEEELRGEVLRAVDRFVVSVSTAADAISQTSRDRSVRRRALLWKVRMIPAAQRAALAPRATEGLLRLFVIATVQRVYLVEGSGRDLFGDQQETARAAALEFDRDMAELTQRVLTKEQAARLDAEVERLAAQNPIRGEFMLETTQTAFARATTRGAFDWFLSVPLVPFRALEGVESGAQAIHEFNATAQQFNELVAVLPEQTRWQLELFLYDVEDRETLAAAIGATQAIAESAERLSLAAEHLPETTRRELVALLDQSAAGQAELRQTLAALRDALASADGAIQNARPLAESLELVAANVDAAGRSWTGVVEAIQREEDEPPDPDARPFDIGDYERAAARIGTSAAELRALVADVRGGGPGGSLLDALLWRALAFVAGAFALLLVYRALAAFVARGTTR